MATADTLAPIIAAAKIAAAKAGVQFTEAHQAALIAWFEPIADADLKVLVYGFASHIVIDGLGSVMQNPIRNAVTGEEPALVTLLNGTIEGSATWFDSWLASIASGKAA